MKQLMSNFKDLDKEVASQAVNIISETQELLGNGSLLVMGKMSLTRVLEAEKRPHRYWAHLVSWSF